jgi:putative ABC transport system ATP-binding protein
MLLSGQCVKRHRPEIRKGEFVAIWRPPAWEIHTHEHYRLPRQAERRPYFLDGTEVVNMNDDQLSRTRNKKIGFVFQSFNLSQRQPRLKTLSCL